MFISVVLSYFKSKKSLASTPTMEHLKKHGLLLENDKKFIVWKTLKRKIVNSTLWSVFNKYICEEIEEYEVKLAIECNTIWILELI